MRVVGYTDQTSVAPGEPVRLMLSTSEPEVDVSLVRLSGDRAEPVPSSLAGRYAAGPQPLRRGSYAVVEHDPRLSPGPELGVEIWAMPTRTAAGRQALVTKRDAGGAGWSLDLTGSGRVRLIVVAVDGTRAEAVTARALRDGRWYHIAAAFSGAKGTLEIVVTPLADEAARSRSVISERERAAAPGIRAPAATAAPLLFAGACRRDEHGEFVGTTFNGRLAAPRLYAGATAHAAAWDFSRDMSSRRVVEVTGNAPDGRTVQMPARAVTGPRWADPATGPAEAPDMYDAIHFHDDDLDDAGWSAAVEWTVDEGLPSGIYAAHVRDAHGGEDHVPVAVRPPRGRATAPILFVAPLFSWLAYGNVHALEEHAGAGTEDGRYVLDNRLLSMYDLHSDGSGVCYSSWRRPVLSMRPGFRLPLMDSPHQFSGDLHLVDWLRHEGYEFDVVTDADLHREGAGLLGRYRVVLSGTHAEYWSGAMLDALAAYLDGGGRYMYLSGNGLYWVTGLDPEEGHTIEIRRYGSAVSAWHAPPGEWHLSTTGEMGGLWRWRGRPPQRYVGVGFAGCWATTPEATGSAYRRAPGVDGRAAFVFEGVGEDELIGDFPNLVLRHGAAGHEVDRADHDLGTPPHAAVLATATDFPAAHWTTAPEEGYRPGVRGDMVFFETPGGGAVFSAGSVAWCGALPYNRYRNNVAQVTRNVLRRFLSPEPFEMPVTG